MDKSKYYIILLQMFFTSVVSAQQGITAEDSLQKEGSGKSRTYLGGYGDISYQRDFNEQQSFINLNRAVLFVGHRFSDRISFFSELELEDAKLAAGQPGGEVALEQAYLKFGLGKSQFITAGLFIPRIGIINENHLPSSYLGVERPQVERYIIPSTWRELGIGFYGRMNRLPFQYSLAICNGLNSSSFKHGTGIRGGRFQGKDATANNMAVTISGQYYAGPFTIQVSGYAGGAVGLKPKVADTLDLDHGPFGTPVYLGEANIRFEQKGFSFRALASFLSIPNAGDINRVYENNTPMQAFGFYLEGGYNILSLYSGSCSHQCWLFARYEKLNLNNRIPDNGIFDRTLIQDQIVAGFSYLPITSITVKADCRIMKSGEQNELLSSDPGETEYKKHNTFLNVGIGYSF